jgi:SAM-dependent methyltransferase
MGLDMPTEQSHHNEFYAVHGDLFQSPLFEAVHDRDARLIGRLTPADAHVISLGCGEGGVEIQLAPGVRDVIGLDLSSEAIGLATRQADAEGVRNVTFRQDDVLAIEIPEGSVDAVWAPAFFHHVPPSSVQPMLVRARRWLRPGGILVTIDPSSQRLVRHLAGIVRSSYDRYHSPDERELDPYEAVAVVKAAGFARVGLIWSDFVAGPLAWLNPPMPRWVARSIVMVDSAILAVPGVRRYASSFAIAAIA